MIHAKNVRHVFKKCSSCQQKYFLSLFNIVFNFLSLFDTENIFLPYLALSLNFVPFITLPSILSFNRVKCHLKEHFTPHVACDQNLDANIQKQKRHVHSSPDHAATPGAI